MYMLSSLFKIESGVLRNLANTGFYILQLDPTLFLYSLLAATPLEASSGTLNVFFLFKISN